MTQNSSTPRRIWLTALAAPPGSMLHKVLGKAHLRKRRRIRRKHGGSTKGIQRECRDQETDVLDAGAGDEAGWTAFAGSKAGPVPISFSHSAGISAAAMPS